MPHRCLNCGKIYEEGAEELLEGCECGSTLFIYEKDMEEEKDKEELDSQRDKIKKEIDDFIEGVKSKIKSEKKVEFDMESISVLEDGVYEINLRKLLDKLPLIIEIKEGRYKVHLASVFEKGEFKSFDIKDLEDEEELKEKIEEKLNEEDQ